MDVDNAALERLLQLQTSDSAIRRLEERRASLPEAARLAEVTDVLAELTTDVEIATKQRDELAREQDRLEGEMEILAQKIEREEGRMFSGSVSNPKELSSLQAEVASLQKKKSGLEDELLEVMVQKDQSVETLTGLEAERNEAQRESEELTAKVSESTVAIDQEMGSLAGERAEIAGTIPPDLLKLYESLRETKGGIGVAALEGGTCQGCHTALPSKEVERLRSERGLQRCDNCRRILVVA